MNVKNLLVVSLSSLFLLACAGRTVAPTTIYEKAVERVNLNLPDAQPINLRNTTWFVVTPENLKDVFEDLENNNIEQVLFGLSADGYEAMAYNMQLIKKYIIEQQEITEAYRRYYENPKEEKE